MGHSLASGTSEVDHQYKYWRWRVFLSLLFGYSFYYLTRKSLTFTMPILMQDLNYTKADLGNLATILSISYAISKFTSGILADRMNARYLMGLGLVVTGVLNILFGLSSSILFFSLFWGFNGWFQGFGAPPCARLLIHWFGQDERGRWWSVWNISHNVGGFLIALIAGYCAEQYGWRTAMYIPGVLCIIGGFVLMNRLRDTPESLGLPPIEEYRSGRITPKEVVAQPKEEEKLSVKQLLFEQVFSNKFVMMLALCNFFVYIIRTGVNDWSTLYLVEERGYQVFSAVKVVCWFDIGGLCGSIAAGWLSDYVFWGRRGPINALFMTGALLAVLCQWLVPVADPIYHSMIMFASGFMIFGPQMLVGMVAAEMVDKKAAGTATGMVGIMAYFGAACAGQLGRIAEMYQWEGYFIAMTICAGIAMLLLYPLWNVGADAAAKRHELRLKAAAKAAVEANG
jgi:OPA family sugar phosphate sensor protein UhpC-like MFS transporter